MIALAAALLAIVTQNQTSLRAAPRDSAAQQAVLWQGDVLELRGERGDYLSVYDHRRERAGFVRASQLRPTPLEPENAYVPARDGDAGGQRDAARPRGAQPHAP